MSRHDAFPTTNVPGGGGLLALDARSMGNGVGAHSLLWNRILSRWTPSAAAPAALAQGRSWVLEDSDAAEASYYETTITPSEMAEANNLYTVQVDVAQAAGAAGHSCAIEHLEAAAQESLVVLDFDAGTIATAGGVLASAVDNLGAGVFRVTFQFAVAEGAANTLRIYPAFNENGTTTAAVAALGAVEVFRVECLEERAFSIDPGGAGTVELPSADVRAQRLGTYRVAPNLFNLGNSFTAKVGDWLARLQVNQRGPYVPRLENANTAERWDLAVPITVQGDFTVAYWGQYRKGTAVGDLGILGFVGGTSYVAIKANGDVVVKTETSVETVIADGASSWATSPNDTVSLIVTRKGTDFLVFFGGVASGAGATTVDAGNMVVANVGSVDLDDAGPIGGIYLYDRAIYPTWSELGPGKADADWNQLRGALTENCYPTNDPLDWLFYTGGFWNADDVPLGAVDGTVPDRSPFGATLAQATPGNRPAAVERRGRQAFHFEDVNRFLTISKTTGLGDTFGFVAVLEPDDAFYNGTHVLVSNSANNSRVELRATGGNSVEIAVVDNTTNEDASDAVSTILEKQPFLLAVLGGSLFGIAGLVDGRTFESLVAPSALVAGPTFDQIGSSSGASFTGWLYAAAFVHDELTLGEPHSPDMVRAMERLVRQSVKGLDWTRPTP